MSRVAKGLSFALRDTRTKYVLRVLGDFECHETWKKKSLHVKDPNENGLRGVLRKARNRLKRQKARVLVLFTPTL